MDCSWKKPKGTKLKYVNRSVSNRCVMYFYMSLWPRICVKYLLSFSLKNLSPEEEETNQVCTFQFLNDKIYNYTIKSYLALVNKSITVESWVSSEAIKRKWLMYKLTWFPESSVVTKFFYISPFTIFDIFNTIWWCRITFIPTTKRSTTTTTVTTDSWCII